MTDDKLQVFLTGLLDTLFETHQSYKLGGSQSIDVSEERGILGDTDSDFDLPLDTLLGDTIIDFCQNFHFLRSLWIEGREPRILNLNAAVDLYADPVDGSANTPTRTLPYGPVISLVNGDIIGSVIASASLPLQGHTISLVNIGSNGYYQYPGQEELKPRYPFVDKFGDLTPNQPAGYELYYPQMGVVRANEFDKFNLVRLGSSGTTEGPLVGLEFPFWVSPQKGHELLHIILSTLLNGGCCAIYNGYAWTCIESIEDLKECIIQYSFNKKYPFIGAANHRILADLLGRQQMLQAMIDIAR